MQDLIREWWEKKFFRVAAYIGFAVVTFVIFLLMTFPDHRVQEIVENEIEVALDHEYDVSITDLGFWRLTGVQASGVDLQERQSDGEDEGLAGGLTVRLEQLAARFSPLRSLINRGPTVAYRADIGGGNIDGTFAQTGGNQQVTVDAGGLDLQESTFLDQLLGVRIFGELSSDVDVTLDPQTGMITSGYIEITGEQITLGETTLEGDAIPFLTEVELPTTSFGTLDIRLDIEETEQGSRVDFERFDIRGRDIQAEAWGHIDATPRADQPSIEFRLQVNQEYVTEHDLGPVFNISEFRDGQFEADDGNWYGFVVSGTLDNPEYEGSTDAARGPDAVADDEQDDDQDDEE